MTQRDGATADIVITGTLANTTQDIEAKWNGGSYTTIGTSVSGHFSLSLDNQTGGQGTLDVRVKNNDSLKVTKTYVGVGEVFACAGQSNMRGVATNLQTYSHATLKAVYVPFDGVAQELIDPTGLASPAGGVASPRGSVLPLIATLLMDALGVPICFINGGVGGNGINNWTPSDAGLYGRLRDQIDRLPVGGLRSILFWGGETDADEHRSQAAVFADIVAIANAYFADTGAKMMICKFQHCTGTTGGESFQDPIIAAIGQAWAAGGNVLEAPDLTDLISDDAYHLLTNGHLQTAADRWWAAMATAFGW